MGSSTTWAEATLGGVLGRLFALAEAYPDLKANQNMLHFQEELTSTENRVAFENSELMLESDYIPLAFSASGSASGGLVGTGRGVGVSTTGCSIAIVGVGGKLVGVTVGLNGVS